MTLVCEQQTSVVLEAEALIREARRRQHRRWLAIGALVVLVAATAGVVAARSSGTRPTPRPATRVAPSTAAELFGRPPVAPSQFIAAGEPVQDIPAGQTGWGRELVLMATSSGRVQRVLARGLLSTGGSAGSTVYFVRYSPNGASDIARLSTAGGPVETVAVGELPTPSPNGRFLAYVSRGKVLDVRDLVTGTTHSMELSPLMPGVRGVMVAGLAWMSPGERLALIVRSVLTAAAGARLEVVGLRAGHLVVIRTRRLLPAMTWTLLARSSQPNTLLAAWIRTRGSSTAIHVVRISPFGRRATIVSVAALPGVCAAGAVDDVDPSGRYVLCAAGSSGSTSFAHVDLVRFERGRYVVAASTAADRFVITSAAW
jgi:hypothetical protein